MKTIRIAVIFGGCSSEYSVSLSSASSVIKGLKINGYEVLLIGITVSGNWYHFAGDPALIKDDRWFSPETCRPVTLIMNRSIHAFLEYNGDERKVLQIDAAFPVLHGRNGEDGTVQGMLKLLDIPTVGCGVLASALCMDKDRAHKLVQTAGIRVPKYRVFHQGHQEEALAYADYEPLPLFIKPVKAGSSYGITKVSDPSKLSEAISLAFKFDDEIIIEEAIDGFEIGCAILGTDDPIISELDEIELSQGFFDYTEKYTLKTSSIHVPARVSADTRRQARADALKIYQVLGCSGFARVDMFVTPQNEIVFNEVNTIPGFTEHSRYPGMMKASGIPFEKVIDLAVKEALEK